VDAATPEIVDCGQRLTVESMALAPDHHSRRTSWPWVVCGHFLRHEQPRLADTVH
jgi:hypothetical protein